MADSDRKLKDLPDKVEKESKKNGLFTVRQIHGCRQKRQIKV